MCTKTATDEAAGERKGGKHEAATASQAKKPVSGAAAEASAIVPNHRPAQLAASGSGTKSNQSASHACNMDGIRMREGG